MLRGVTGFSCPRSKQHLDQLSGCAGTLPTNFHRTHIAVSCVCFSASLFDAPSLFAWIGLYYFPRALITQRLAFWIVTVLVLGLIAIPWFAPLFYSL